ncbi:FAD-binding protein [Streptomyces sp. NPDC003016]
MTGLEPTTDVLVVGGGPAATRAALKAAQDGSDVILADQGYCGTVPARRDDCQTCFPCEANCPADALYVAPLTRPLPDDSTARDEEHLDRTGLRGSYRRHIGWGRGRTPGALRAVGPPLGPPGSRGTSLPITS